MAAVLLVVLDALSVTENLSNGLDDGGEFAQLNAEFLGIKDLEEIVEFCLLGNTTPAVKVSDIERPWSTQIFIQDITLDVVQVEAGWGGSRHVVQFGEFKL